MSDQTTNVSPGEFPDQFPDQPDELRSAAPRRSAGGRAVRVVVGVAIFVGVGLGLYAASPWILPLHVSEGPLVQDLGKDHATLVWFLSRSAPCTLTVSGDGGAAREIAVERDGARFQAEIQNLPAGKTCEYRIIAGDKPLHTATLRTAPADNEPFSFVVFGDSGRATRAQYTLARHMADCDPAFLLHTGDMVYPDGARRRYDTRFFEPYAELIDHVPFWPCLGNHDVDKLTKRPNSGYEDVFVVPANGPDDLRGRCYWFDYGPARVVVLDTNLGEKELLAQGAWLRAVFADPAVRWRFVSFHHPPYTAGPHHDDVAVQRAIVPALEAAGVDIVFNGHDHMYERSKPLRGGHVVEPDEGVVYVVTGAGGAKLYEIQPDHEDLFATLVDSVHSFTVVSIYGDTLELRQIGPDGKTLDTWKRTKAMKHTERVQEPDQAAP